MDIPAQVFPAIGAITAAVIAGAISFVSTVLSKEQKTSEFRQAWIDALREDLSEFVSQVHTVAGLVRAKMESGMKPEEAFKFLESLKDGSQKIELTYARIRLRLNPNEHTQLISALNSCYRLFTTPKALDANHCDQLVEALVVRSQDTLKSEWARVKRGERAYVATKYSSLLIFVVATIAFILVAFGRISIKWIS